MILLVLTKDINLCHYTASLEKRWAKNHGAISHKSYILDSDFETQQEQAV